MATAGNPADHHPGIVNRYGLGGVEHLAMPATRPEETVPFYLQVLGGTIHSMLGYDEEDKRMGRQPHIFTFIGETRVQLAYPSDGKSFADPESTSDWPCIGFAAGIGDFASMCLRLSDHGVPFSGPWSESDGRRTSIYFLDPVGNKLALRTDGIPSGLGTIAPLSGYGIGTVWPSLRHGWAAPGGAVAARNFRSRRWSVVPPNAYGITHVDHVSLPARESSRSVEFYVDVLGGLPLASPEREPGVPASVQMGTTVIELAYPTDGRSFPEPDNTSEWPHWAFDARPDVVDAMCERLHTNRVPFSGPWRHRGSDAIGVYFKDPEGNKLEIRTAEPYPDEKARLFNPSVGDGIDWPNLTHHWRRVVN